MRASSMLGIVLAAVLSGSAAAGQHDWWADKTDPDYANAPPEAVEAWKDQKFGMRIHWGPYSVLGCDASWPTVDASTEFKHIWTTAVPGIQSHGVQRRGMGGPDAAGGYDLFCLYHQTPRWFLHVRDRVGGTGFSAPGPRPHMGKPRDRKGREGADALQHHGDAAEAGRRQGTLRGGAQTRTRRRALLQQSGLVRPGPGGSSTTTCSTTRRSIS